MEIDQKTASAIVANIKDVLQHEINLFDTHGTIIASTDVLRIGTHHEGALLAANQKITVTVDDEHQYVGAKNGINVPVMVDGEVVAVVGVTGKRSEVESFGNIIRKMTEILIRENMERNERFDRRMSMLNLMNQLIDEHPNEQVISYLSSALHWDPQRRYFIAVGRLQPLQGHGARYIEGSQSDAIFAVTERTLRYFPHSLHGVTAQECCLFLDTEDLAQSFGPIGASGSADPDTAPCVKLLNDLGARYQESTGLEFRFGIGTAAASLHECSKSYHEATTALQWLQFWQNEAVIRYKDLDIGLIIPQLPTDRMREYANHVFNGLSEQEINEFHVSFDAYRDHNGSITHAAEALYIHKNTMQNHLNRIADMTGYNPRELQDFMVLALAFKIHDYLRFVQIHDL